MVPKLLKKPKSHIDTVTHWWDIKYLLKKPKDVWHCPNHYQQPKTHIYRTRSQAMEYLSEKQKLCVPETAGQRANSICGVCVRSMFNNRSNLICSTWKREEIRLEVPNEIWAFLVFGRLLRRKTELRRNLANTIECCSN